GKWWMPGGSDADDSARGQASAAADSATAPVASPVGTALLLHGGYYRSRYTLDLMDPMAADLARRGWAVWNVEYRRTDAHGWESTIADVRAALAALARIPSFVPGSPLIVIGHSAGGQLALQLAEQTAALPSIGGAALPRIALAVSLAGVVDLPGAFGRNSSDGAVAMALGGSPAEHPERYAAASPSLFARRRTPWLLVQGTDDVDDFRLPNRELAANARVGHPELLERPGDHFAVIDPAAPIWQATLARIGALLTAPERGTDTNSGILAE
ncbi:MAG: hypothetical protein JWR01_861, partial [Subtercola sp.]|nr:hypothetical protein [Subtercola sp.]